MRLFWIVTAVHLLIVILFGIQRKEIVKPPAKIEVHTVQLQPKIKPAVQPAVQPSVQNSPAPIVQEERSSKVQVREKPKVDKPVAQKSSKPTPKKPIAQKKPAIPGQKSNGELKRILQDSLASLDKKTSSAPLSAPTKVGKLQSEAITFITYEALLVEYLRELLELPEPGEVKLRLTVTREGRVRAHTILEATKSNRAYIDREIISLHLPPFESHFKGEKEHTFPITLKTY